MSTQNKRPRPNSDVDLLRPPLEHMESYKLLRNLKTKLYKAQKHVDNLTKCLDNSKPPSRLYPRMRPFVPTNECVMMLEWEKACLDFAKTLTRILCEYWQRRVPHLIKEIEQIDTQIKGYATEANYNIIIALCDKVIEKHKTRPSIADRRTVQAASRSNQGPEYGPVNNNGPTT